MTSVSLCYTPALVIEISMMLYLLGTCVSMTVVVVDMSGVLFWPDQQEVTFVQRISIATVTCVLILPLALLRNVDMLELGSFFGVFVNVFACVVVVAESAAKVSAEGLHPSFQVWVSPTASVGDIGVALSSFTFSNECTLVFIPVFFTLQKRTVARGDVAVLYAYIVCFLCYFGCGCLGYMAFGDGLHSDILAKDLPTAAVGTALARICLALKSFVHFPIVHFPARLCLLDMMQAVRGKWRQRRGNGQDLVLGEDGGAGGAGTAIAGAVRGADSAGLALLPRAPAVSSDGPRMSMTHRLSEAVKKQVASHAVCRASIFRAKHRYIVGGAGGVGVVLPSGGRQSAPGRAGASYRLSTALHMQTRAARTAANLEQLRGGRSSIPSSAGISRGRASDRGPPSQSTAEAAGAGGTVAAGRADAPSTSPDGSSPDGSTDSNVLPGDQSARTDAGRLSVASANASWRTVASAPRESLAPPDEPTPMTDVEALLMSATLQHDGLSHDAIDLAATPHMDFYVATFAFMIIVWFLTVVFDNLGTLINLITALFGVPLVYIMPGLAWVHLNRHSWVQQGVGIFLCVFGITITVASVIQMFF